MIKINEEVLLRPIRAKVDKIMIVTLGILLPVSIGIGWFYNALLMALLISVPAFIVPFFIWKTASGSFLLRIAVATGLVFNVAVHIQASHGLIEMHFGVFAILAFLLAYRDWKVIVYGAGLVAVHHVILNFLQAAADYNVWLFRYGASFDIVVLHALFVVFESVILVLLAVQLRKELVHLANVAEIAERIAEGDLSSKISIDNSDFVAVLLHSMQRIQDSLNSFVIAQEKLAQRHLDGFISERIDESKLLGIYGEIASKINELVASHITVKMQVIDVISHYAKGDFSVDMERLPNEKAKISYTIDDIKTTLLSVSNEIDLLVKAGANGDFTYRGNANRFGYMFREMILSMNGLLETCDDAFKDIERVANALAKGDLTQTIGKSYAGTFGNVTQEMNCTVEKLKSLIAEIKESSETISVATKEIVAGNNDLSRRTEEQSTSLEKTATTMTELTSTVQSNTENARHGNQLAIGATDIAGKGLDVVNSVVTTMADINNSSLRIVDIISVIDDIAFQTNILALNAAVEAARAGEQGKGFAVVAIEVRNLAQRASNAAGEIKRLIDDSVEKINGGGKLVNQAGKTMTEIVDAIQHVTQIMSEISNASAEQSDGIYLVNSVISEIDDVTQQNAALVEEAATAAESLKNQVSNLSFTLGHFKIKQ